MSYLFNNPSNILSASKAEVIKRTQNRVRCNPNKIKVWSLHYFITLPKYTNYFAFLHDSEPTTKKIFQNLYQLQDTGNATTVSLLNMHAHGLIFVFSIKKKFCCNLSVKHMFRSLLLNTSKRKKETKLLSKFHSLQQTHLPVIHPSVIWKEH